MAIKHFSCGYFISSCCACDVFYLQAYVTSDKRIQTNRHIVNVTTRYEEREKKADYDS